MPMARALRRTISQQAQERRLSANSSNNKHAGGVGGGSMLQNGGGGESDGAGGEGSAVPPVEKAHDHSKEPQANYPSPISGSLCGGVMGFPSGTLPSSASAHSGNLPSVESLLGVFPLPCLRFMRRTGGSMERGAPKTSRGMFWKKPMLHLLLCLVLGIVVGFSSISWSDFSSSPSNDSASDLGLVNGFVTNLRTEGSQTAIRGEKLITYDTWRVSAGVGSVDHVASGVGNARELQIEQLGSGLSVLAPGLNYTLDPERKLLIIVTPTYNRAFQAHYLTRLAHALKLVAPPLLWLVVEMPFQTLETASFLRQTGIMYRHLVCRTNHTRVRDRAVHQRNFALEHIEKHQLNGIVYFADDDNVYSQDLFEQMRKIRRFGTWPVGILAESKSKAFLEGPVCDGDKVIGWHTSEKSKRLRRFHVDMSGFAFNSTFLWDSAYFRHRSAEPIRQLEKKGLQETTFIEQLVEDEDQMQGLPSGCNKIMVWHQAMESPDLAYPYAWSLATPLFPNIPLESRP